MFEAVVIIALVVTFNAAMLWQITLLLTIRSQYPDYYRALGSPAIFMTTLRNASASMSFFGYILGAKYVGEDIPQYAAKTLPRIRRLYFVAFFLLITLPFAISAT